MTDHTVTIDQATYGKARITCEGGHIDETFRETSREIDHIECSCGEVFTERRNAIDHLRENDTSIDYGAYCAVIESLLPEGGFCDLDDSFLLGFNDNLDYQIRLFADDVANGTPQTGHVWLNVGSTTERQGVDKNAYTDTIAWRDAVDVAVSLCEVIDEGTRSFYTLAKMMGDWQNAERGVEIGEYR